MSDQLKADLDRLRDLVGLMSTLRSELDGTPSTFDEYAPDMGTVPMSGATIALGDDWDAFRLQLIADIEKLGAFADTSAKTYAGVDEQLARDIQNLLTPPPSRPHGLRPIME